MPHNINMNQEDRRIEFELFKSNICHSVKNKGELGFVIDTLSSGMIQLYWDKKWYLETFYTLAMVDYLCRINNLPICTDYNSIRAHSLTEPVYPRDVELIMKLNSDSNIKKTCEENAIPEFLRFNIMECDIRDVY